MSLITWCCRGVNILWIIRERQRRERNVETRTDRKRLEGAETDGRLSMNKRITK